jgi:AcrR family transcriptional regulator
MREPPRRLDREQVIAGAERLIDRVGWRELTMAELASEVGVKASSLYNHVSGLQDVVEEVQARAFDDLGRAFMRATSGRAGERGLRSLADAWWTYGRTYPHRYDLAMRANPGSEGLARRSAEHLDAIRAVLESYDLAAPTDEVLFTVFAALHGVLDLANCGYLERAVDPDAIYLAMLGAVASVLEGAPTR